MKILIYRHMIIW